MRIWRRTRKGSLKATYSNSSSPILGVQVSQVSQDEQQGVTLKSTILNNSYKSPNTGLIVNLVNNSNRARKVLEDLGYERIST